MKRINCLLLIFTLFMEGCSKNYEYDFSINNIKKEELITHKHVIHSLTEFTNILDYLAFYQVNDKITFTFSNEYKSSFYNPYQEYLKAYKRSDIAESLPCIFNNDEFYEKGEISLKFSIPQNMGNNHKEIDDELIELSSFNDIKNGEEHILPIENKNNGELEVSTSEQLFYALSYHYLPLPKINSNAEEIYQKMKEICYSYISKDDDELMKSYKLYRYLVDNIYYDFSTAYSGETYLYQESCYYLEGVFLYHQAVCDGLAKAYTCLLSMEGINSYRSTGKNSLNYDHAWNYININSKWYVTCPTYGRMNHININDNRYASGTYNMFLKGKETPYKEEWCYVPNQHEDIYNLLEEDDYLLPYQEDLNKAFVKINDKNILDLNAYLNKMSINSTLEFVVENEDMIYQINDLMLEGYVILLVKDNINHYLIARIY